MEILTVKIHGDGYLINGADTTLNPTSRAFRAVQEWIAEGNTPEPEFTQAEIDAQAAQAVEDAAIKVVEDGVRGDVLLQNFIALGPDGIESFITNNITDPATRGVLIKLSKIVWLGMKDKFPAQ